jgi:lambda family phage portal protein
MAERSLILDATGTPIDRSAMFGDTSWNGASGGREMEDWEASRGSADADLQGEHEEIAYRSRDADRNSPVAHSAIQATVSNVVGPGFLFVPNVDYVFLGKSREWAIEVNRMIKTRFRAFYNSTDIDATGIDNGHGLTALALRSVLTSGGMVALPIYRLGGLSGYGLKLHFVEIDRVSTPYGEQDGENYRNGIGFDEYGKPMFYDIRNSHPGDVAIGLTADVNTWTRIPAETSWGRQQVLHVFDKERIDVSRGVSGLARVLPRLHTFDKLTQNTLQKEFANSLVGLILKTNMSWDQVKKLFSSAEAYLKYRKSNQPKLGPASVLTVAPGEDVVPFSPGRPGSDYDAFSVNIMREIAAGMNLPYELAMRAFSGMNYSNARVMLAEAWRGFSTSRQWLINRLNKPILRLWIEEEAERGEIPDLDPDELFERPGYMEAWTRSNWIGTGRGYIDPKKEGDAQTTRLKNFTSNLQIECAEQGLDWEEVLEQAAYERQVFEAAKLIHPNSIPTPAHAPIGHNQPPDDEDPDAADREMMR